MRSGSIVPDYSVSDPPVSPMAKALGLSTKALGLSSNMLLLTRVVSSVFLSESLLTRALVVTLLA